MKPFPRPETTGSSQLAAHVERLRERLSAMLRALPPERVAAHTGSAYRSIAAGQGEYHFHLWGKPVLLIYPGFVAIDQLERHELSISTQALVLYYFVTADGTQPGTPWISFADLPDGRFYNQAFQGYTGAELARACQNDLEVFGQAALQLGGKLPAKTPDIPGDLAFIFKALPRLSVLVAYWQGDEDFPPAAQILFEHTAPHYLPTDVCAILGSTLTRQLIKKLKNEL